MSEQPSDDSCRNAPVAYQSLAMDGTILDVNAEWEALSGYSAAEMVGRNYLELVPPEHADDFAENIARLKREGRLSGADCFLRRKDGGIRDVQIFGRAVEGEDRSSCILVDVTGFRDVERALGESEERFRSLFELAPTPIVIHNGQSIVMANQTAASFLGYETPEELVGVPVVELVHPDDRTSVGRRVQRLMTEDWIAPFIEERFVRKDGSIAYGNTVASPIFLEGQRAVHVIALDLKDTREAQRALEESEARFRTLFEFSGDPIVVHDGAHALFANQAALEQFGMPMDADVRGLEITPFIHVESLPLFAARLDSLASDVRGDDVPGEYRLIRADGSEWIAEAKTVPLTISGQRVLQTTFRDLTYRKYTEAELARYREQLEELVAERTESLERVKHELEAITAVVSRTVEMRDPYTAGHQRRVAALAVAIARHLEMSDLEVEQLDVAARLHDVGKVSIPAEILSKPATLTTLEYALVKTHVEAGFEIVSSAQFEGDVAEIMHQHHERLDGSGYPRGLREDELLPLAKVLMVADVVEAMSSHRPYRPSLGATTALAEIVSGRGRLYDPAAVDGCVSVIEGGFDFEAPVF